MYVYTLLSPDSTCGITLFRDVDSDSDDQIVILQEMHSQLRDNLIHYPVLDLDIMDSVIVDAGRVIYLIV